MSTDTREKLENYTNNAVNEGRYSVREREEDGEWVLTVGDLPQDVFMLNALPLSEQNVTLNEWLSQKTPDELKRDFADIYQYEMGDDLETCIDEAYKQQFTFFADFEYEDNTNDYGTDFHYTFVVGIDPTKEDGDPEKTIYADMSGHVNDYDYNAEYTVVTYSDDNDKCYILNAERTETLYSLPHDIIETLEKLTEQAVIKTEIDKLHHELYDCYIDSFNEGWEIDEELRSYDDWLATAYPDEGYFAGHVDADMAKFLCENDPLINLDYYELYEENVRGCFSLTAASFEDKLNDASDSLIQHFDVNDAGLFHEDIDKLISRSISPYLLETMSKEYEIQADSFSDLFFQAGDISNYVGFEVGLTGKEPKVTAYVDFSTRNAVHSLGQIPLSARESAFVLKACDEVYKQNTGKSLLDKLKEDKTVER